MYNVYITKEVVKQCKKQGKAFKKEVSKILVQLRESPILPQTEKLTGELKYIYSYHFSYSGTTFRLCYLINEKEKTLTVIMVGPRENFYKILKQKIS